MKGYRVERRWGWDCHGLPIENIAEKELGIKEKKDIETMGVAKFNEFCRSKVLWFVAEWQKTVRRMGKWIEFDNAYKTMDNDYMESVWFLFKKLYDEGYVYQGKKILLYCPRCETPLASSEIAMDNSYKSITEKTAIVKFKLKNQSATFFLAWTTTPWTLIGNVALAVNTKLMYAKIRVGKEKFILAKDRLQEIKETYDVLEEMKGEKLVNIAYDPLYHIPADKKGHYVINGGDEVSATEGTGIVHMALYGEFDYEMVKKYDLPIIQHVSKQGKIAQGPEEFRDLWFKKADAKVLEDLEKRELLVKAENYTHEYPFCYRCDTPLFYNALDSWFINIQKIKDKVIQKNKEIKWYPEHLQEGRFKNVLETAPDWNVSRNRFWATPLPIWKCSCGEMKVIGSIEELRKHGVEKIPKELDLHKHTVDAIHFKCAKCKGIMTRIPEVMDCWFESGSMPYAAKHYPFENQEWFKTHFPADFISEYIAQVRTWFYYMHVLGVLLFDRPPFKNVVVTGTILASDGRKMSKSKGNFPDPADIFDKYGADALRFYLMNSNLMRAEDLNFNEAALSEVYKKVILILSNVTRFYEEYVHQSVSEVQSSHILDKWIVSKLNLLIRDVTNSMDDYNTVTSCNRISEFINELSTWYVRRSRDRFNSEGKEKQDAINTLGYVLVNLAKIIAPIMPFIAEDIYQVFKTRKESVHLDDWPVYDEKRTVLKINEEMKKTREIVSLALEERNKIQIPVRQVLAKLEVTGATLGNAYLDIIKEEINVKTIELKKGEVLQVKLDTKITPELEKEGYVRELTRKIQDLRKKAGLKKEDKISLVIDSVYNLSSHQEEIKKKVGATSINFTKIDKEYKHVSKERIKDHQFHIGLTKKQQKHT